MKSLDPPHAKAILAAYPVLQNVPDGADATEHLYRHWYAAAPPARSRPDPWAAPITWSARAAHVASARWSAEPVEVLATGVAGVVVVASATGRRALCRGEYVTSQGRPGFPPRVGDWVQVVERLGATTQDGWWRSWGPAWDAMSLPSSLIRLYLRPTPGSGPRLVRAVTGALAEADQWMLKVAATPDALSRPDAAVLYLAGQARAPLSERVVGAITGLTGGTPPPLTCVVGDGVGWAEDPGSGVSFGEDRCAIVAAAHRRLVAGGSADVSDTRWLAAVAAQMVEHGLDPMAPHLAARELAVAR